LNYFFYRSGKNEMRGEELGSEIKKGARKNQLRNPAKSPE
jgi:hypothetical protein